MSDAIGSAEREAASAPREPARKLGDPGWSPQTWDGATPEAAPAKSLAEMAIGALRLVAYVLATLALLPVFFAARALGGRRDRAIAGLWCGAGMALCGLRARRVGRPMSTGGMILANHASWLDIMVLGWLAPVHFVAKAEVSGWPLFGWIGRISNTVFIARKRTEAKAQERLLTDRAHGGDLLCVFPEGTSTDGRRVLPFKTSLFALFYAEGGGDVLAQPVSVHYAPRAGLAPSFYGWWGRMPLFDHIWDVVCLSRGGVATVIFHEPLDPADFADRKALATEAQRLVAEGRDRVDADLGPAPAE